MDCLVNQTAKYRYMSGGQLAVPLVVRTQAGAAGGAAAQHSQSLEAWFIHVPGLVVVAPSTPAEAYGLLKSAIRLGEPVLFVEHKRLYTMKEELAEGAELPPIGTARIAKAGTDVTRDRLFGDGANCARSGATTGGGRHFRRSHRPADPAAARHGEHCGVGVEDPPRARLRTKRCSTVAWARKSPRASVRNSSTNWTLRYCAWAVPLRRFPSLRSSSARCCRGARISCAQARSCAAELAQRVTLIAQEIPKVGLVMEEVKVIRWLKNVGDQVVAGEPLLEVETEKSVVEIEAAATGRLAQILVEVDSPAAVGDQVAWIESAEAPVAAAPAAAPRKLEPETAAPTASPKPASPAAAVTTRDAGRIRSSPVARQLAAERGIDLGAIAGTGPGGRVQLDDVQRAIDASRVGKTAAQSLSPMRRALARAMTLSNATIPQFTVARCGRVDRAAGVAPRVRRQSCRVVPPSCRVNDFLLQAVARALIEIPALNATFSGDPDVGRRPHRTGERRAHWSGGGGRQRSAGAGDS